MRPNPDYGQGIFRRRIRLESSPGCVFAELEDTNHGFQVCVYHDGKRISEIASKPLRFPYSTCPGASVALKRFVGCALDADMQLLRSVANPSENCTHLHDLVTLAMAHSQRHERERLYDIVVPDERDGSASLTILCNGDTVHNWQLKMPHRIVASNAASSDEPDAYSEGPLMSGFYPWARQHFSGDRLEAAVVLQRGYFVAQTRRYDFKNFTGRSAVDDKRPATACHTYNTGVVEQAVQVENAIRDFTDTPENLLKFI